MIDNKIIKLAIEEYISSNNDISEISLKYNIGVSSLRRHLNKNGIIHKPYSRRSILKNSDEIIKLRKLGCSNKEISRMFKISEPGLIRFFRINGLTNSRTYKFDIDFFENIDNFEKAIILGFLYADGWVDKYSIKIHIQKRDEEILNQINSIFKSENYIKHTLANGKHKSSLLTLNSKKTSSDLMKLGCPQTKTYKIRFPDKKIKKTYLWAFLYGYWLGDGWSCCRRKRAGRKQARIGFVSNKWFILGAIQFLKEHNISTSKSNHAISKNIMSLLVCNKYGILRIISEFKKYMPLLFINRKIEKLLFMEKKLNES